MNDTPSTLLREVDADVYNTIARELGFLAIYCNCKDCPELPLRLRRSLHDARVARRCKCGEPGCKSVRLEHKCNNRRFNTIAFSMPGVDAMVLGYCESGHAVDIDWLEDLTPSRV